MPLHDSPRQVAKFKPSDGFVCRCTCFSQGPVSAFSPNLYAGRGVWRLWTAILAREGIGKLGGGGGGERGSRKLKMHLSTWRLSFQHLRVSCVWLLSRLRAVFSVCDLTPCL